MASAEKSAEADRPVVAVSKTESAQLLFQAAADGDAEKVKHLISKGIDVNTKGTFDLPPLLGAVGEGHVEIVKVLLENGANVGVGDCCYTPLYYAIWEDPAGIETAKALISAGADVNAPPKPKGADYGLLDYAVLYERQDMVRILIKAGADVNAEYVGGLTPLHHALRLADADMAKLFVGTGVEVPAFHNAILEGNLAEVKQLVESGTDVDTPDRSGWTPARWAVCMGQKAVVEYLLNQGADPTGKVHGTLTGGGNKFGDETLLHQASKLGSTEIAKALIANGAQVDAKGERAYTPLQDAAKWGREEVAKLLIANGADVNYIAAKDGAFPLRGAAGMGHEAIVELLIANGAKVGRGDDGGRTALHVAAHRRHSGTIDILVAHGADVNAVSQNGTPLHFAANPTRMSGEFTRRWDRETAETVQKLLDHGADVGAKHPQHGGTPLYEVIRTQERYRHRTAEVLIVAGADVNATDNDGRSLLSLAKEMGHAEVIELLLKHGAKE